MPEVPAPKAASRRPLSILFAANYPAGATSGIGNHLTSLAAALRERGHRIEIIWSDSLRPAGKPEAWSRLTFPFALAQWIRKSARRGNHFDVVNVHEPSGMWCALWRRWSEVFPAVVVTSHGVEQRAWDLRADRRPLSFKSRVVYPLTQLRQGNFAIRHADAVAVLSTEDAAFVHSALQVAPERVHVLFNGVEQHLLDIEWQPSERPQLLFLGTWISRKGTELLTQVFRQLRTSYPWLEMCLAGTGLPAHKVLAPFSEEERRAVTVLPKVGRGEIARILGRDQIFVLPSYFEGMPLSLLEAMAAGLPCVTSDTCGMRDLLLHAKTGFLLPPGQEELWREQLESLLKSPETRKQVGAAARIAAQRRTWNFVAEDWETLFYKAARKDSPSCARQYDAWHAEVAPRDDLEKDLSNPWHTFARAQAGNLRGMRVLDAACGRGQFSQWLAQQGACVVAADFSQMAVRLTRNRLAQAGAKGVVVCGDVGALPFPDASFDQVLSCETLEHVPSPTACLKEFARVLRPGGRLVLTTENYLNIWGIYRLYCAVRGRLFNSGDLPQPRENWMFSPQIRRWVQDAGLDICLTDGEEHHLYLLPGTNPSDCEARSLSTIKTLRRWLRFFGRRFYVVAQKKETSQ